jgi:uncharacterized protein YicC (UPF0701 family)
MLSQRPTLQRLSVLLALCILTACGSSIALFDQYAYTQTTSLKVEALTVLQKATQEYAEHKDEVEAMLVKLDKIYEYEKHRPKNEISTRLWDVVKNPDRNLVGGMVKRWKNEGKLNAAFVQQATQQISEAFDIIAELESKKLTEKDTKVVNLLNAN